MTTLATFDIVIRGDTRQFEQSVQGATRTGNSFVQSMGSIASGFLVANVAMSAFSAGIGALKEGLIGYNARMEQAEIGFKTLFGSADKAATFIEQLRIFAAKTPFDFPGLQQAATTMIGMGFAAQDVLPTLEAVGDVVAGLGKTGGEASATINRIVYNLGQMKQYGKVTGRDIRDLTMLGVPVVKILANGFNKSTTAMQEMISKGTLPADKALKVLVKGIEEGDFGGLMDAQAKTFSGAMSTIRDTLQNLTGTALKPLFDAISKVVVAFSQWVQSKEGQQFADAIAMRLRALVIVIESIIPAITAMGTGIRNAFNSIVTAVRLILSRIAAETKAFTKNMTVGGWNAIVAYAQGMWQAYKVYVTAVVNSITTFISSYLIGMSPPPKGPLSKIYEGGRNTIEAWVEGAMSADMSPILKLPDKLAQSLKEFKAAAKAIESTIKGIDRQTSLLDLEMSKLQMSADRITRSYQTQLDLLRKQLDTIMDTYSFADKRRDLELALRKNMLEQQYAAAKGDWWAQAKLKAQMDSLDKQIDTNRLLEEQESLQAQIAALPLEEQAAGIQKQMDAAVDPIQKQLDLLSAQRAELDYQRQVWQFIADDIERAVQAQEKAAGVGKGAGGKAAAAKKIGGGAPGDVLHDIDIDEELLGRQEKIEKAAQTMADTFINSFGNRAKESWPTILGAVIGGALGLLSFTPFGVAAGAAIGGALGTAFDGPIKDAVTNGMAMLEGLVGGEGGAGFKFEMPSLDTILENVSEAFQNVFDWIVDDGVPKAAEALGKFAIEFVNWVGEAIPKLLEALPKITAAIWDFIAKNGPVLLGKLLEWTLAFVGWVITDLIPALIPALAKVGIALLKWIAETSVIVIQGMIRLGKGLLEAIITYLSKLPGTLADIFNKAWRAVVSFAGDLVKKAKEAASGFLTSVKDTLVALPGMVGEILGKVIAKIGDWVTKGVNAFKDLAGKMGRAFANTIVGFMEDAINGIIRGLNKFRIPKIEIAGNVIFTGWPGLNLGLVNLPRFQKGIWNLPITTPALVHRGEMVLPADLASKVRKAFEGGVAGGGVTVMGPLVNIEQFHGTREQVDKLMDDISLELRLATRKT